MDPGVENLSGAEAGPTHTREPLEAFWDSREARFLRSSRKRETALSQAQTRLSTTKPTLTIIVGTQRTQEVDLTEGRPGAVAEVVLRLRTLPKQKAREPDLAAGAQNQVRFRLARGIETL